MSWFMAFETEAFLFMPLEFIIRKAANMNLMATVLVYFHWNVLSSSRFLLGGVVALFGIFGPLRVVPTLDVFHSLPPDCV